MSDDTTKRPPLGALLIDARSLDGILVDVKPGSTRGMQRAQPGFDEVLQEIFDNQPTYGAKIGILQSHIDELKQLNEKIERVNQFLPAIRKLGEMMVETLTVLDNRRHEIVRLVARNVDAYADAEKDDTVLAKYAQTRRYRSAIATKAAKTRKKKAAAAAQTDTTE